MGENVTLELTREEFIALHNLVMTTYLSGQRPSTGTPVEWHFVREYGNTVVTLEDLYAKLSEKI